MFTSIIQVLCYFRKMKMSSKTGYSVVCQDDGELYIGDGDPQDPEETEGLVVNDRVRVMPRQFSIAEKHSTPAATATATATATEQTDPVSDAIGEYGRWQLLITFLLSLFSFPVTFVIYSTTFIAAQTSFWCARPVNLADVPIDQWKAYSQPAGACSIRNLNWSAASLADIQGKASSTNASLIACTTWEFDPTFTTILSEWNLVCGNSHWTNLADLLFLTSVGFGGIASGFLSDKFGRKKILFIAQASQTTIGIVTSFVPHLSAYLVLRTLVGLVAVTVVTTGFVLSVEMVSGQWTTVAGVCNFFPLPVSYVLVSAMSLLLPDWRQLQLAISLPGLFLLPLWFVIPESPRWLLSQGHTEELSLILDKAAKFNGRAVPSSWDKLLSTRHDSNIEKRSTGVLDLYREPLRKRSIILIFLWFTLTLSYYGLVLNIGNLGGTLHLTSIILGLVEIPSIALSIPILLKMGRRYPIFLSMGIAGLSCIISVILDYSFKNEWLTIAFVTIGKFCISATNIMMPTYTAELYPTYIRNLGVGTNQMPAGIALMCIPYLWEVPALFKGLPITIIGVLSILGGVSVLLLPETGITPKLKTDSIKTSESAVDSAAVCHGSFTLADKRERW